MIMTLYSNEILLPCPFCGGKFIPNHPKSSKRAEYESVPVLEKLTEGGWRVNCYGCGVQTWDELHYAREDAISAWNTRVKEDEPQ
jgi:hypothetical protein